MPYAENFISIAAWLQCTGQRLRGCLREPPTSMKARAMTSVLLTGATGDMGSGPRKLSQPVYAGLRLCDIEAPQAARRRVVGFVGYPSPDAVVPGK